MQKNGNWEEIACLQQQQKVWTLFSPLFPKSNLISFLYEDHYNLF